VSLNTEPTVTGAADPKRWRALAVTQLAGFMSLLDVSIVNVALPSIQRGLGASAGTRRRGRPPGRCCSAASAVAWSPRPTSR